MVFPDAGPARRSARRPVQPDRFLFWALGLILIWAPLPLASNRPWAWSMLELALFTVAAGWLGLFLAGRVRVPDPARRAWLPLGLLAIWVAVVALQLIPMSAERLAQVSPQSLASWQALGGLGAAERISIDPDATRTFLLKSAAYAIAFGLVMVLVNSRKRLRHLALLLVLAGVGQGLIAIYFHLSSTSYELLFMWINHGVSALGTFANRDHLAGYLEMTLALGIGLMIATLRDGAAGNWKQRLRGLLSWLLSAKILIRVMLIVMVIALVMTRSRMGNSAFFISMLAAGLLGILLSRRATRSTVFLLLSIIVIDVFIVGSWFGMERLVQRFEQTTIAQPATAMGMSLEERAVAAVHTLELVKDFPWVGSGGGTFYVAFPRYRPEMLIPIYDYTHNDYVQFLAETGVVGTGLLGLLVLATLFVALRTQYERRDPLARGVSFGVTMGVMSLMIHSWVDFNLQIPANALTFVVLLAMGWVAYSVERNHQRDDETAPA